MLHFDEEENIYEGGISSFSCIDFDLIKTFLEILLAKEYLPNVLETNVYHVGRIDTT